METPNILQTCPDPLCLARLFLIVMVPRSILIQFTSLYNNKMAMPSVEIMLVVLALLCLPNLFYRATFNIPILIFTAAVWTTHNTLASQLLVISWIIELYQLLDILITNNRYVNPQKNPVLLTFTILVFVLKTALIVFLIVKDDSFRKAISIRGWLTSIGKGLKGEE